MENDGKYEVWRETFLLCWRVGSNEKYRVWREKDVFFSFYLPVYEHEWQVEELHDQGGDVEDEEGPGDELGSRLMVDEPQEAGDGEPAAKAGERRRLLRRRRIGHSNSFLKAFLRDVWRASLWKGNLLRCCRPLLLIRTIRMQVFTYSDKYERHIMRF